MFFRSVRGGNSDVSFMLHPVRQRQSLEREVAIRTMTPTDENELHRLSDMLRAIDRELERTSPLREALNKAGVALNLGFCHGLRPEIEHHYQQLGVTLTDAQRAHLSRLGIDPEAP